MLRYHFYRDWYFSLNGTIANVVLHDLDLNFQGQTFQVAILKSKCWKMQRLLLPSDRKWGICHQIGSPVFAIEWIHCECYTSWSWPIISRSKFWDVNSSKTVGANEKCSSMTCMAIDIFHRLKPLRMLYCMTLTFSFNVKHFLVMNGQ